MGALLVLAVLAQDPEAEWAGPETVTPPPSEAPVGVPPAQDPELDWHRGEPVILTAERSVFRASLELAAGFSPAALSEFGGGLEVGWLPIKFLRLDLSFSGAFVPPSNDAYGAGSRGAMRVLAGFDGVLPFGWGELFVGLQSGFAHSNVAQNFYYDCFDCRGFSNYWEWQPSVRLRGGFDVLKLAPLSLGLDVAYSMFGKNYQATHWAELHGRVGLAF